VLRCTACGHENPETSKFCGECGAGLATPEAAHEVRKTVTVVFCDVVGSTAMGEALDPESVRRVMGRYFDAMRAAIEHHGGTVEKFIGDAVMAVFGVPQVHEDDALRAVRAAGEMRAALPALNADLEREYGVTLNCRIGVNTGEVVAGVGDQTIVTGDAVNVAARLEQAASAGEVFLGEDTFALVRDAVVVEPTEPLYVKGKTDALSVFRLVDVTPGAEGFARHLDAPMVGRERELTLLRDAFERTVNDRVCSLLTILGVAGVGKSRLMAAFVEGLGDRATVLRGRCLPYGEGITFHPLAEALIQVADLSEADTPQAARSKLAALAGGGELADRIAERVGQTIGIPGSQTTPEETLWAIRVLLERLARERPVVFVLDDLQWAEPKFLEVVRHVADFADGVPLLLACMARPELLDEHAGWSGDDPNATSMMLEPLGLLECGTLVANVLLDAVDEGVRARIADAAGGHPLYAEEIIGLLVDQGRLALKEGRWVATADLSDVPIPPTISALLAARLDRLPPAERQAIDIASVMGQVFYPGAAQALAHDGADSIESAIATLVRKQFVRPERSDLPATEALAFRHLLIRDAAYQSIPKQRRADLHENFADWLERMPGGGGAGQEEIVGHHLEQAYACRAALGPVGERGAELAARAATHLESAASMAAARGDPRAAASLLERAISLLPAESDHRIELAVQRGTQLFSLGELREADVVLEGAVDGALRAGAKRTEWRARVEHTFVQIYLDPEGKTEAARHVAEQAISILGEFRDDAGLARTWELMSVVHWLGARAGAAGQAGERGLAHARRAGDAQAETRLLQWTLSFDRDGPKSVADALRRSEEILADAGGNRLLEADALAYRGIYLAQLGRFAEARVMLGESRAIVGDLGLRGTLEDMTSWNDAIVDDLAADFPAAERSLREQFAAFERMGEQSYLSTVAGWIGRVMCERGNYEEAERFTRICEESAASDDLHSQILWRGVRGRCLSRRGDPERAEALAREAVSLSMRTDFSRLQAYALMDLADVLHILGRPDEAVPVVAEAVALYRRKGVVPLVARAEAVLQELVRDGVPLRDV
jgi:class 3 adenylate cyclase/tetratricopeptide (TPR) repeat protein